eukprot:TRINITY_DN4557_c1_g1_i2.p1 TRINITY_DN4557_c1_g1~~TRINITY_DN4557_c1_g1_i2.p1  ORF type:complete len:667 (-),score=170.04 TRINITY_DN4557_c1_g1_i2:807-2807(-)
MCEHAAGVDARSMHVGRYSAWLTKVKNEGARARWFSSNTKRYFTLDFEAQIFFYSQSEDRKKTSQWIPFKDIAGAEILPRHSSCKSTEHTYGFLVKTPERNFELYTVTYMDAQHWVDGLNAARDIAAGTLVVSKGGDPAAGIGPPPKDCEQSSRSSFSTAAGSGGSRSGSESGRSAGGVCSNDPPPPAYYGTAISSGGYGGGAPFSSQPPVARSTTSPAAFGSQPARVPMHTVNRAAALSEEKQKKPWEISTEVLMKPPEEVDPFAALDALEELAGPPPEEVAAFEAPASAHVTGQLLRDAKLLVTEGRKPKQRPSDVIGRASTEQQGTAPAAPMPAAPMPAAPMPAAPTPAAPTPAAPVAEAPAVPRGVAPAAAMPPAPVAEAAAPAPSRGPAAAAPVPRQQPPPVAQAAAPQPPPPGPVAAPSVKEKPSSTSKAEVLKDECWDSDDEESTTPPPPAYRPSAAKSSSAWPEQQQQAPAPPPPPPVAPAAGGAEAGGWDSDDEPAPAPPPRAAAQVIGEGPAVQHGAESSGWDDEDVPAAKASTRGGAPLSTCGAPQRPAESFVAAAVPAAAAPKKKKKADDDDDLDDLVGEVLAVSSSVKRGSGDGSWMVPDFQCTGCDFQILCVDDFVWRNDVEYMFFRNNYPTVSKLRSGPRTSTNPRQSKRS